MKTNKCLLAAGVALALLTVVTVLTVPLVRAGSGKFFGSATVGLVAGQKLRIHAFNSNAVNSDLVCNVEIKYRKRDGVVETALPLTQLYPGASILPIEVKFADLPNDGGIGGTPERAELRIVEETDCPSTKKAGIVVSAEGDQRYIGGCDGPYNGELPRRRAWLIVSASWGAERRTRA